MSENPPSSATPIFEELTLRFTKSSSTDFDKHSIIINSKGQLDISNSEDLEILSNHLIKKFETIGPKEKFNKERLNLFAIAEKVRLKVLENYAQSNGEPILANIQNSLQANFSEVYTKVGTLYAENYYLHGAEVNVPELLEIWLSVNNPAHDIYTKNFDSSPFLESEEFQNFEEILTTIDANNLPRINEMSTFEYLRTPEKLYPESMVSQIHYIIDNWDTYLDKESLNYMKTVCSKVEAQALSSQMESPEKLESESSSSKPQVFDKNVGEDTSGVMTVNNEPTNTNLNQGEDSKNVKKEEFIDEDKKSEFVDEMNQAKEQVEEFSEKITSSNEDTDETDSSDLSVKPTVDTQANEELHTELEELKTKNASLENEVEHQTNELKELKSKNKELENKVQQQTEELNKFTEYKEKYETEQEKLKESSTHIKQLEIQIQELIERNKELEEKEQVPSSGSVEKSEKLEVELASAKLEITELKAKIVEKSKELDLLVEKFDSRSSTSDEGLIDEQVSVLVAQVSKYKDEVATLKSENEDLVMQINSLNKENKELVAQISTTKDTSTEVKATVTAKTTSTSTKEADKDLEDNMLLSAALADEIISRLTSSRSGIYLRNLAMSLGVNMQTALKHANSLARNNRVDIKYKNRDDTNPRVKLKRD